MASKESYTITLKNNKTEKEALNYLLSIDNHFILPTKDERKELMKKLSIDKKYSRAFDLIHLTNNETDLSKQKNEDITLIELKTTKKKLENNPKGFFFGATQNEFDLAKKFKDKYKFCFVSLHPESLSHSLLTLKELELQIKTKRIQYQINLKN